LKEIAIVHTPAEPDGGALGADGERPMTFQQMLGDKSVAPQHRVSAIARHFRDAGKPVIQTPIVC
jgi:hypothetical protein